MLPEGFPFYQFNIVNFILIIPIMAGYPSKLAKKFSPAEQFPQHILPLLPLYNAQWWGYELLTAIDLVTSCSILHHKSEGLLDPFTQMALFFITSFNVILPHNKALLKLYFVTFIATKHISNGRI